MHFKGVADRLLTQEFSTQSDYEIAVQSLHRSHLRGAIESLNLVHLIAEIGRQPLWLAYMAEKSNWRK